ncbi:MAG TPA: FAD-dependent oxidoreductase [Alphaproteobacteria bacterium]|nr:MAG: FAD-dependent oxidoreductase [Rhodospirillales bacterium]HOO82218.1 FAD-dependent oxidoreductase [Alphaproteobacteria bacterium]
MADYDYDYFVIGAGSGGVRSARIAAGHGAKVGVAEKSALGGTCVNLGCIPKKLFAYASDYTGHFEDARGFGWDAPAESSFDWRALINNKNNEISRLNGIYKNLLENSGVEILSGRARFIDDHTLEVGKRQVSADKILIAVGGRPRLPDIEGGELMATSDDVFFWPKMPEKVVIQGGGYIAVEFAHILHGIGAHVTLLYRGELFLRGFDRDIARSLADEMAKQGVDLRFNCDITRVERKGENGFIVYTEVVSVLRPALRRS